MSNLDAELIALKAIMGVLTLQLAGQQPTAGRREEYKERLKQSSIQVLAHSELSNFENEDDLRGRSIAIAEEFFNNIRF